MPFSDNNKATTFSEDDKQFKIHTEPTFSTLGVLHLESSESLEESLCDDGEGCCCCISLFVGGFLLSPLGLEMDGDDRLSTSRRYLFSYSSWARRS